MVHNDAVKNGPEKTKCVADHEEGEHDIYESIPCAAVQQSKQNYDDIGTVTHKTSHVANFDEAVREFDGHTNAMVTTSNYPQVIVETSTVIDRPLKAIVDVMELLAYHQSQQMVHRLQENPGRSQVEEEDHEERLDEIPPKNIHWNICHKRC